MLRFVVFVLFKHDTNPIGFSN